MRLQQEVELLQAGQVLTVLLPLAFEADLRAWSLASGNQLLQIQSAEGYLQALIQKGSAG